MITRTTAYTPELLESSSRTPVSITSPKKFEKNMTRQPWGTSLARRMEGRGRKRPTGDLIDSRGIQSAVSARSTHGRTEVSETRGTAAGTGGLTGKATTWGMMRVSRRVFPVTEKK